MTAILITGGAGYIGSHVAWACVDAGREVVVVDNLSTGIVACVPAAAQFHEQDIADTEALESIIRAHGVDAIMHFAGSVVVPDSVRDPLEYYRNNVLNTHGLLSVARKCGVRRFVFSSTAAVYEPRRTMMLSETDPTRPISPYGWSKLMTEQMLADCDDAYGLRYCALRYFNVSGADPKGRTGQCTPQATHLIKVAAETAVGRRRELTIFGDDYETPDGTCVRDYVHVWDLAQAHILALEHLEDGGRSEIINVGNGRGASVREVVSAFERRLGRPLPVRSGPRRAGDAPALVADNSKIGALLGWQAHSSDLDTIVAASLAWEQRSTENTHY